MGLRRTMESVTGSIDQSSKTRSPEGEQRKDGMVSASAVTRGVSSNGIPISRAGLLGLRPRWVITDYWSIVNG